MGLLNKLYMDKKLLLKNSKKKMSETTIRKQVKALLALIRDNKKAMDPHQASDYLVQLAAWHAGVTEYIANMEKKYNDLFFEILDKDNELSYNKAQAEAKTSDAYYEMRKAQNLEKSMTEEIRALKHWIRVREREWENTK